MNESAALQIGGILIGEELEPLVEPELKKYWTNSYQFNNKKGVIAPFFIIHH